MYHLCVMSVLLYNGYWDYKDRTVWTFPILLCYGIGIFLSGSPLLCVFGLFITLFNRWSSSLPVGDGDLDMALLALTAVRFSSFLWIMLIACMTGTLYYLVKHDRSIPFVTCLAIGYTVWHLL